MRLEAHDLAFGYPGHPVGRGVTLAFEAGEIVCLLGPNGGGKTTFFRTLLGLLAPQGGAVLIDGCDLAGFARADVARRLSYVPQAHAGYFPFTVRDVVLMGRTAHLGVFAAPSRHDREVAAGAIARMGLSHLAESEYTRISGGERQLALIARALAQEGRIVVMDEPTASLDFGNQVKVLAQVRALAATGIGVVMATHDPDQAFMCADRVALFHQGTLLHAGTPDETLTQDRLRTVYGIEVRIESIPQEGGASRRVCLPMLASGPPLEPAGNRSVRGR
jgi:iron complex transport system ATP-binding protein